SAGVHLPLDRNRCRTRVYAEQFLPFCNLASQFRYIPITIMELQNVQYENAMPVAEDDGFTDVDLVIDQVEVTSAIQPDAVALVQIPDDGADRLLISYAQLDKMASRVKNCLKLAGI